MFGPLIGLLSQDLALDPGSSVLRIHPKAGAAYEIPSVVTVRTASEGRRQLVSYGEAARKFLGRAPPSIEVVRPFLAGRVADHDAAEALLLCVLREVHGRNSLVRPSVVVAVPHNAGPGELRALRDCCSSAGARHVQLVAKPLAAALGAGLPVHEPAGNLVIDVGAGSVDIALVAMDRVVSAASVPAGGDAVDEVVARHVKRTHALLIGPRTAESAKLSTVSLQDSSEERLGSASGRCLRTGLPSRVILSSRALTPLLMPLIDLIAAGVRAVLDAAPRELAADVTEKGAVLVGGGARLRGLSSALRDRTGLPMVEADDPERAVLRGLGLILDDTTVRKAMAA